MPLKPDNPTHRGISDRWDAKYSGQAWYDKAFRPSAHSVYHAARSLDQPELKQGLIKSAVAPTVLNQAIRDTAVCVFKQDPVACSSAKDNFSTAATMIGQAASHTVRAFDIHQEEWAQAKDQLSRIGTGQNQTQYLETHRENAQPK